MANIRQPVELERLERAASKLRPIERAVLVLSAGEGLWNDEVAARLGITTAEAERHLASAIAKLLRNLRRQERPWWRFW